MVLRSAPLSHGIDSQTQFEHPEIVSFYNGYKGDLKIYLVKNRGLINMWHPLRLKTPLRFCSPFQKPLKQVFESSSMKSCSSNFSIWAVYCIQQSWEKFHVNLQLLKSSQQNEKSESYYEWYFRTVKPQYHDIRFAIIMMKSKFGRIRFAWFVHYVQCTFRVILCMRAEWQVSFPGGGCRLHSKLSLFRSKLVSIIIVKLYSFLSLNL